jgi:hypothetical protein
MTLTLGLNVIYIDANGVNNPAIISAIHDGSGVVDLFVFVSEAAGFRNDQTSVNYSATGGNNTWSNL